MRAGPRAAARQRHHSAKEKRNVEWENIWRALNAHFRERREALLRDAARMMRWMDAFTLHRFRRRAGRRRQTTDSCLSLSLSTSSLAHPFLVFSEVTRACVIL